MYARGVIVGMLSVRTHMCVFVRKIDLITFLGNFLIQILNTKINRNWGQIDTCKVSIILI